MYLNVFKCTPSPLIKKKNYLPIIIVIKQNYAMIKKINLRILWLDFIVFYLYRI